MEERLIYINNDLDELLIKKIINLSVEETRCFLMIVNELQVKNKLFLDDIYSYGGEEYNEEEWNVITVELDLFKRVIKNKNKHNQESIVKILNNMLSVYSEYFEKVELHDYYLYVEFKEKYVYGNNNQSLLNPDGTIDRFIEIDLSKFIQLRSNFQIFFYLKIMQFTKTGIARIKMEEIKDKIFTRMTTKEIIRKIKNAIVTLESILEIEIEFKTVKKGRNITSIELNF